MCADLKNVRRAFSRLNLVPFGQAHIGLGAPQARPAGAERGDGVPASDGDGGSGGAKPPGLITTGA